MSIGKIRNVKSARSEESDSDNRLGIMAQSAFPGTNLIDFVLILATSRPEWSEIQRVHRLLLLSPVYI